MSVSLAVAVSIAKNKALQFSSVNITNITMNEEKNALIFHMSDGTEISVNIDNINGDTSKVFVGEGEPSIKANNNDLYIDKQNRKIYYYYDYKWGFVCDMGESNELVEDIENIKNQINQIQTKLSKLNVGVRLI